MNYECSLCGTEINCWEAAMSDLCEEHAEGTMEAELLGDRVFDLVAD